MSEKRNGSKNEPSKKEARKGSDKNENRAGSNFFIFSSLKYLKRMEIIIAGKYSFVKNGIRKKDIEEKRGDPKEEKIINGIEIVSFTFGIKIRATNKGTKIISF